MSKKLSFPEKFLWGCATSAYQIEGAHNLDGKGESIWDRYSHTSGKIEDNTTGDVACDHYNRWRDDIKLMQALGLQTYRFSLAWTRILPNGRGAVNQKGLDFYKRILDELTAVNIKPSVTLFHWDLPQALQDEGGWAKRSTAEASAEYADVVLRELGRGRDDIMWTTHNEPAVAAYIGHRDGRHAPGITDLTTALQASHHLLLSHGLMLQAIRSNCPKAEAGIVLNIQHTMATDAGHEAYNRYRHSDGAAHRWFLDPVFGRRYPTDILDDWFDNGYVKQRDFGVIRDGDLDIIGAPIDYLGVNYYMRDVAARPPATMPDGSKPPISVWGQNENAKERTDMGWEVYPEGLFAMLCRVYFDYRPKAIYITENGCSYGDAPDGGGRIKDARRTKYLKTHLVQVHRAIQEKIPVKGYYLWSLMDNFEWGFGFSQRFGIVWVDFETQERILKDSAHWYKDTIAANGFALES